MIFLNFERVVLRIDSQASTYNGKNVCACRVANLQLYDSVICQEDIRIRVSSHREPFKCTIMAQRQDPKNGGRNVDLTHLARNAHYIM